MCIAIKNELSDQNLGLIQSTCRNSFVRSQHRFQFSCNNSQTSLQCQANDKYSTRAAIRLAGSISWFGMIYYSQHSQQAKQSAWSRSVLSCHIGTETRRWAQCKNAVSPANRTEATSLRPPWRMETLIRCDSAHATTKDIKNRGKEIQVGFSSHPFLQQLRATGKKREIMKEQTTWCRCEGPTSQRSTLCSFLQLFIIGLYFSL